MCKKLRFYIYVNLFILKTSLKLWGGTIKGKKSYFRSKIKDTGTHMYPAAIHYNRKRRRDLRREGWLLCVVYEFTFCSLLFTSCEDSTQSNRARGWVGLTQANK